MKETDFAPRASFLITKLKKRHLVGIEVGCDVGAHAEALLTYTDTIHLTLIDLFENPWCEGYCFGRLARWRHKVTIKKSTSHQESQKTSGPFDYIYIDILHDEQSVANSLNDWWPHLAKGGILGYRNYSACKESIDRFVSDKEFEISQYHNEIVIWKR